MPRKKVLIALNGGIRSAVAAYLLKQQSYEVIGLAVNFSNSSSSESYDCYPVDLDKTAELAKRLGIGFYATVGYNRYQTFVLDKMISAKIVGQQNDPYINATRLLFDLLVEKAHKLGADFIASGHKLKSRYNKVTEEYELLSYAKQDQDSSYYFSLTKQKHLEKVLFPLSDIDDEKVFQIAKVSGIEIDQIRDKSIDFMNEPKLLNYYDKEIPESLKEEGEFLDHNSQLSQGSHLGVFRYHVGQTKMKDKFGNQLERGKCVVKINHYSDSVLLGKKSLLENHCYVHLVDFYTYLNLDKSRPSKAAIRIQGNTTIHRGLLVFKSNSNALFEFDNGYSNILVTGQSCALYLEEGENLKLIGGACVVFDLKDSEYDPFMSEDKKEEVRKLDLSFSF